jgi:hypothetical protein
MTTLVFYPFFRLFQKICVFTPTHPTALSYFRVLHVSLIVKCNTVEFRYSRTLLPPPGLTHYREEEVRAPQWPRELCWRERKFLLRPSMPGRSQGRGQTKCSPWSSSMRVGRGANNPTPKNLMILNLWRRPRPTQGCSASKEEEEL